jgi:hypothetical protein
MSIVGTLAPATTQEGGSGLTAILNQNTFEEIRRRPFPVDRLNRNVGERPVAGIPFLRDSRMSAIDSRGRLDRDFFINSGISNVPRVGQSLPSIPDLQNKKQEGGQLTGVIAPVVQEGGRFVQRGDGFFDFVKRGANIIGNTVARPIKLIRKLKPTKALKIIEDVADVTGAPVPVASIKKARKIGEAVGFGDDKEQCMCGGGIFDDVIKVVKKGLKVGKTALAIKKELTGKGVPDDECIQCGRGFFGRIFKKAFKSLPSAIEKGVKTGIDIGKKVVPVVKQAKDIQKQLGKGAGRVDQLMNEIGRNARGVAGIDASSFVPTHPMNINATRLADL